MANDIQNMNSQVPTGVNTISQVTSRMNGYHGNLGPVEDTMSKFYSLVSPYRDILQKYLDEDGENSGLFGLMMNNYTKNNG